MKRRITDSDVTEMFALIGEAVWHIQNVEEVLHTFIAFKRDIRERGAVTEAEAEMIITRCRQSTLGRAITEATEAEVVSPLLQERLRAFNPERRWLVHRSTVEKGHSLYVDESHSRFLERVLRITGEARALHVAIAQEFEDFVVSKGVPRGWIDREARKRLEGPGNGQA